MVGSGMATVVVIVIVIIIIIIIIIIIMGYRRLMVGSGMATGDWTGSGKWQEVQEAAMEIPPSLQQIESNDLTKIKELGRGQFGSVWLCRCATRDCLSHQARHTIQ